MSYDIAAWNSWLVAIGLTTALGLVGWPVVRKLLTPAGLLHAWCLGVIVGGTLGWPGFTVVLGYFLVGSGMTRVGMAQKEAAGIAEKRSGARGPENVWGSAAVGAICALATLVCSATVQPLLFLAYVASFCTKLSDTTASEVGKAYGQRTFLITTLKPVPRGTEGAVSLEGTVAGVVASVGLAVLGWGVHLISPIEICFCIIAAFVATTVESLIGATWQTQVTWLTNEVVNAINTGIGALTAIGLALLWSVVTGL